jgi:integrative and conjugative element protein (TIGR02256 family)
MMFETTVWLLTLAYEAMIHDADVSPSVETGGALLGYWSEDQAVITASIGPGPNARHGKTEFCPDQRFHEEGIAQHYLASNRVEGYLGDWHTHPAGSERLSRRDCRTLAKIARSSSARAPRPLMAVLHGGAPWQLAVWLGHRPAVRSRMRVNINLVRIRLTDSVA